MWNSSYWRCAPLALQLNFVNANFRYAAELEKLHSPGRIGLTKLRRAFIEKVSDSGDVNVSSQHLTLLHHPRNETLFFSLVSQIRWFFCSSPNLNRTRIFLLSAIVNETKQPYQRNRTEITLLKTLLYFTLNKNVTIALDTLSSRHRWKRNSRLECQGSINPITERVTDLCPISTTYTPCKNQRQGWMESTMGNIKSNKVVNEEILLPRNSF